MTIGFNYLGKLGQLGNQMFQYAATLGVARYTGVPYCIPNHQEVFDDGIGNKLRIELFDCFNIKPENTGILNTEYILQEKGFVGHTAKGRSHRYHPLVSKDDYAAFATGNLVAGYFGSSVEKLLSFFVKEKNISMSELDEMLKKMNQSKES